jgi:uncharacterized protein (DUF58 family)
MKAAEPPASTLPPPEGLAGGNFEMVVRRLADDLAFGSDASRLVGSGLEYAGSRPYVPGDPVRSIDWRVTARAGRAFIREHEALKRTAVYLVVDTSASMSVGSGPISKHGLAVWVAASLGLVAQRRMSPVAIVGGGERSVPVVPSLARADLWNALEPLRGVGHGEGTNVGERLRTVAARAARASVVVAITDMHCPEALPALGQAAQRHDCVVIHVVDPAESGPLRAGFVRGREAETGRAFTASPSTALGRPEDVHAAVLRCGADCLQLATDRPFVPALRGFLATRGMLARGRA